MTRDQICAMHICDAATPLHDTRGEISFFVNQINDEMYEGGADGGGGEGEAAVTVSINSYQQPCQPTTAYTLPGSVPAQLTSIRHPLLTCNTCQYIRGHGPVCGGHHGQHQHHGDEHHEIHCSQSPSHQTPVKIVRAAADHGINNGYFADKFWEYLQ